MAEDHDVMIASVLQALDAAFNLYGIHLHPLGGGELKRPAGQETSAVVADEEWQGEVRQGELLSVRSHLLKGHVCADDGPAMDTKRKERYRQVH